MTISKFNAVCPSMSYHTSVFDHVSIQIPHQRSATVNNNSKPYYLVRIEKEYYAKTLKMKSLLLFWGEPTNEKIYITISTSMVHTGNFLPDPKQLYG